MGLRAIYSGQGLIGLWSPSGAEIKNKWSDTSTFAHGVDRGNLTFTAAFIFHVLQNSKKSQVWVNSGEDPAKGQEYDNKQVTGFVTNSNEAMDNFYSLFGRIICTGKRKIRRPKHKSIQTDT